MRTLPTISLFHLAPLALAPLFALLVSSDRKGIFFKSKRDAWATRVGRRLRRVSLEATPQLIKVCKRGMAFVGPRPAPTREVSAYPAAAVRRLAVKPGLAGVWRVGGRAEIDFDRMVDIDANYTKSRSSPLDVAWVVLTTRAAATGTGAH